MPPLTITTGETTLHPTLSKTPVIGRDPRIVAKVNTRIKFRGHYGGPATAVGLVFELEGFTAGEQTQQWRNSFVTQPPCKYLQVFSNRAPIQVLGRYSSRSVVGLSNSKGVTMSQLHHAVTVDGELHGNHILVLVPGFISEYDNVVEVAERMAIGLPAVDVRRPSPDLSDDDASWP